MAPHNDISGGKRLRSRTLKTNNRVGQVFRLAAQSVAKSPNSVFGAFDRRMKSRLGAKQAIVATAHKMARAFYYVLKHRIPFHDLGGEEYERRANERVKVKKPAKTRRQTRLCSRCRGPNSRTRRGEFLGSGPRGQSAGQNSPAKHLLAADEDLRRGRSARLPPRDSSLAIGGRDGIVVDPLRVTM